VVHAALVFGSQIVWNNRLAAPGRGSAGSDQ
jgi:hypothetical protein